MNILNLDAGSLMKRVTQKPIFQPTDSLFINTDVENDKYDSWERKLFQGKGPTVTKKGKCDKDYLCSALHDAGIFFPVSLETRTFWE